MTTQTTPRGESLAARVPWYPLLFAAYPVLFLYSNNLTDVAPEDVVVPLLVVLGGTAAAWAVLSLLWRDVRRAALVVSALVVPLLLFMRIYRLAPPALGISRLVLLIACLAGIALVVLVAIRIRERLGTLTLLLNAISVVLIVLTLLPISSSLLAGRGESSLSGPTVAAGSGAGSDRDIWYLVFDRYGSERALAIGYGIEANDLLPWLRERGFQVLDGSHANYVRTNLSLASVLNLTYLDELAAQMGPDSHDFGPVNRSLRASDVAATLKDRGYEYVHIGSWFDPTRGAKLADRNLSPESSVSFASTVYGLSALPFLTNLLGLQPRKTFPMVHERAAHFELDRLHELVGDPGPDYVFAHLLLPHPPYVFLEDGTFAPGKATFESQWRYTNARIKGLVEELLALPEEERPIIILQADEGPYPKRYEQQKDAFDWAAATPDELATKFGILNAMYLPGPEGQGPVPSDLSSVNTFRTVFRRYFGADLPDLPDRSYVSSKARPYDLLDITDRIPAPGAG